VPQSVDVAPAQHQRAHVDFSCPGSDRRRTSRAHKSDARGCLWVQWRLNGGRRAEPTAHCRLHAVGA